MSSTSLSSPAKTTFSLFSSGNKNPYVRLQALALPHRSRSCFSGSSLSYSYNPLRVLILARGTAVQKSFIVPLFALQAPASIISWIQGRYGGWSAFLALLVRLFFYIPGELELPFVALLLVIVAPYEVMKLRGTQEGAIISLLIAGYLAFQHFSRASLQKAFDQGSIVATLAVTCIAAASLFLVI